MSAPYQYVARIGQGCELFEAEPFASAVKNCGEMILTSRRYTSYEECSKAAQDLITQLGKLIGQLSKQKHVVTCKINPLYDNTVEDKEERAQAEVWTRNTVMRVYLADAKHLKKNNELLYNIFANINVTAEFVQSTNMLMPQSDQ